MKNIIYYFMLLIVSMSFIGVVKALDSSENSCTLEERSKLRSQAASVSVTYQPFISVVNEEKVDPADNGVVMNYLDMSIYNINTNLRVVVSDNKNAKKYNVTYKNLNKDGAIVIRRPAMYEISNMTFEIYGSVDTGACYGEKLRTMKLTLPKFNNLSERDICSDIPEFYMCQRYILYDVDSRNFEKNVTKYKEKLLEYKDDNDAKNGSNGVSKLVGSVSKNRFVIVGIILAIGIAMTIVIIKRKRGDV